MTRCRILALALLATACTSKTPRPVEQPATLTPVQLPDSHPPTMMLPDPEVNGGHVGRAPRRITVNQLKASIVTTTGRQWSQIDNLAASLGKADYAVTVSDSTEANLVFAKFLEDGAREVCLNAAGDDIGRAQADRVLSPEIPGDARDFTAATDAQIANNLRTLSVRFWGQPMNDAEIATWSTTFKTIAARAKTTNQPKQAWGAMCVAFMTDSRFITY